MADKETGGDKPSAPTVRSEEMKSLTTSAKTLRKQLITNDSFVDDFNCRSVRKSIKETYAAGKEIKAAATKGAGGTKKKDEKIAKDAKKLLWGFVGEQWCMLLLGLPFMFLGSLVEFLVPNYIGKIIMQFKENNFDGDEGVKELLFEWIMFTIFSAVCTAIREAIFGITSQKLGMSIRARLYSSIIRKDINFYDNIKTGALLSRLGSDTQVVQDGLTTSVSMFIKSACIIIGTMAILFTYNTWIALIVIGIIIPQFLVTRISAKYLDNFAATYQKAKGTMSNIATESLSNVRTVKCFGDEEMTTIKFAI